VAVQHHRRGIRRAHLRHQHRALARGLLAGLDLTRLEPALDEAGGLANRLRLAGVVGDQALGERD
jgi:hypothetical protein